ncbi:O-antigen ligase family protein [Clostridium felsineum]|nr:hypothetical protein [Clostridium felsineum]
MSKGKPSIMIYNFGLNQIMHYNYYNIFYMSQNNYFMNHIFWRNEGIFLEPGVYGLFINFALLNLVFNKKSKYRKLKYVVLIINMVLTFSTQGYIVMICIFVIHISKNINERHKTIKMLLLSIVFIFGVLIGYYVLKYKSINGAGSILLRSEDFKLGFSLFVKKPLLGWGILNDEPLNNIMGLYRYKNGNSGTSNGLIMLLYQGGIYMIMLYIIPLYYFVKYYKGNFSVQYKLGFIVWIVGSLFSEPLVYSKFFVMLISYGIIYMIERGVIYEQSISKYNHSSIQS